MEQRLVVGAERAELTERAPGGRPPRLGALAHVAAAGGLRRRICTPASEATFGADGSVPQQGLRREERAGRCWHLTLAPPSLRLRPWLPSPNCCPIGITEASGGAIHLLFLWIVRDSDAFLLSCNRWEKKCVRSVWAGGLDKVSRPAD